MGFVTRGRGVSIHRRDCVNLQELAGEDRSRLIEAQWERGAITEGEKYTADIKIFAGDRKGLLVEVSRLMAENNISIRTMNVWTSKQGLATMETSFEVGGIVELRMIIDKLRSIEGVIDVERQ